MVAQTIELPNIRKIFIPDAGMYIAEADLSGADAQVVAWEAQDEELKAAFRAGLKIHLKNAREMFPEICDPLSDEAIKAQSYPGGIYYDNKRAVHATNYGARPKRLATTLHWTMAKSDGFQRRWFGLHPGIREWHRRTMRHLTGEQCWQCDTYAEGETNCGQCGAMLGRTVRNKFGYRIIYFDRVESLLPQALAWAPQSTVAHITFKGARRLRESCDWVQILMQVHDSLIFQYPRSCHDAEHLAEIKRALTLPVPYDDPLTIPWGLKVSDVSWGDAEDYKW